MSLWVRVDDVLWRRLPDGVLVLAPSADEPLAVLGSAAAVWPLLDTPRTVDELVTILADGSVPRRTVEHDVTEVVSALAAAGAVHAAPT